MSILLDAIKKSQQAPKTTVVIEQPKAAQQNSSAPASTAAPAATGKLPWGKISFCVAVTALLLYSILIAVTGKSPKPAATKQPAAAPVPTAVVKATAPTPAPVALVKVPASTPAPVAVVTPAAPAPVAKPAPATASIPESQPIAAAPQASTAVSTKPPKLEGIAWDPDDPMAILSGRPVRTGATVNGWKVQSIAEDSAVLSQNGETQTLQLPNIQSSDTE